MWRPHSPQPTSATDFALRSLCGMTSPTLSLCMMSRKPAARVRALLELFRPIVDEIVLAADRTGDPRTLAECADLADKRFEIDPAPLNRRLGWLQEQCSGDWIFRFDDDEAPSATLLASLRTLIENRALMQIGLTRRWLFGSPATWIDQHPWTPDYQIRLVRNTPGAWRYPGLMHAPIQVLGELGLVETPIYHCELLLASLEETAREARQSTRRDGPTTGTATFRSTGTTRRRTAVRSRPPKRRPRTLR